MVFACITNIRYTNSIVAADHRLRSHIKCVSTRLQLSFTKWCDVRYYFPGPCSHVQLLHLRPLSLSDPGRPLFFLLRDVNLWTVFSLSLLVLYGFFYRRVVSCSCLRTIRAAAWCTRLFRKKNRRPLLYRDRRFSPLTKRHFSTLFSPVNHRDFEKCLKPLCCLKVNNKASRLHNQSKWVSREMTQRYISRLFKLILIPQKIFNNSW